MSRKVVKSHTKSNVKVQNDNYKFNVNTKVVHLGGLYPQYKSQVATIVSKYKYKSFYNYYEIMFEDGHKMEVKEEWIKGIDMKNESEDVNNENN
jgi:hypothetical protein